MEKTETKQAIVHLDTFIRAVLSTYYHHLMQKDFLRS